MEELLKLLAKEGALSVMLAVSISGNIYLVRLLIESYDKRLTDIKENKDTILKLLDSIKQTADTTLSGIQAVIANNKS